MRRVFAAVVVAAILAVSTVAYAGVVKTESYKDVFPDITYSGSAGSIPWGYSPWQEVGESDGPGDGRVHVDIDSYCFDDKCLQIFGEGETFNYEGAERYGDVSIFEDADICYDLNGRLDGAIGKTAKIWVKVTDDFGESWTEIDSFKLDDLADNPPTHGSINVSSWLTKGFGVKFVVSGLFEGEFFIDNVEIKGVVETTSTTSSTTSSTSSTTTTTKPKATTTTTIHEITTTTTERETTTTTERSTTTTNAETTTTSVAESSTTTTAVGLVPVGPVDPPRESGLRDTDRGIQANYSQDLFGAMDMGQAEVLGVAEFNANYSMAVEVFSATWIWMVALLLIIATAIVSGLDRRRPDRSSIAA